MTHKRIFVTGASGCIGHYMVDQLIHQTQHELFLLVRNPEKLKFDYNARPGIKLLVGDIKEIDRFAALLQTIDCAILAATSWGGFEEVYDVNVTKTQELINLLNPDLCQQIIYFSTASILDRQNQPLPEAGQFGTDYIRSKYLCHQELQHSPWKDKITTVYPTLVFGGDDRFPKSHLSSGLKDVVKWIKLIRFFRADGSFHFIHGRDIAQVVNYFVDHPPALGERRDFVLGNDRYSVDRVISEVCAYLKIPIYFRIPLYTWLADLITFLFRIQMADWDRFSLRYRHFTHQQVVNPQTFGLVSYCSTLGDVLRITGILR
ncbi:NAD(P)-dependent oxidoreductase [Alkalinema sp. FACHB-956]|uniref:NAD-dependent epimerase/dehydratase family protein n=1 Tax=Alkalinema sp. FACHB-956 TaxID=2692768 RepID=UPI001685BFAF|nr:NAD(P)-dependent oxidoreductase [Alkalinema sp. FACHB-956]MBD2325564.1 NAD(P)-dependent oxidoreductase [Alkalinema sp. FACHB-956]